MADGTGLLNPDPSGSRGFESHRLRLRPTKRATADRSTLRQAQELGSRSAFMKNHKLVESVGVNYEKVVSNLG